VLQSGRPSFVGYLEGFAQKFCSVSGAFESCLVWHGHVLFKVVDRRHQAGLNRRNLYGVFDHYFFVVAVVVVVIVYNHFVC
jgi:hypothetical protein